MTVTDVAEQPPVITSYGGSATAALSVPENQGTGRECVRPTWPSVATPADLRRRRNRDNLGESSLTAAACKGPESPRSTRRAERSLDGTSFRNGFTVSLR